MASFVEDGAKEVGPRQRVRRIDQRHLREPGNSQSGAARPNHRFGFASGGGVTIDLDSSAQCSRGLQGTFMAGAPGPAFSISKPVPTGISPGAYYMRACESGPSVGPNCAQTPIQIT